MLGSGSQIGTSLTTTSMRRIGIRRVLRRREWSDRFAVGPGIARSPILRLRQEGAGDSPCRLMAQAFAVHVVLEERSSRSSRYEVGREWRRDSARRLPLRQTGLPSGGTCPLGGPADGAHTKVGAVLSRVIRRTT